VRRNGQEVPGSLTRTFHAWGLTRVTRIEELADQRGSYLLLLRVLGARITVGAIGPIRFRKGLYGYVGSATGRSVTLAHRLGRHLRRKKARRWHIDYLTSHRLVAPVAAYVSMGAVLSEARLAGLCAERFPAIPGFGNGDQRGTTPGHLFLLQPKQLRHNRSAKQVGDDRLNSVS